MLQEEPPTLPPQRGSPGMFWPPRAPTPPTPPRSTTTQPVPQEYVEDADSSYKTQSSLNKTQSSLMSREYTSISYEEDFARDTSDMMPEPRRYVLAAHRPEPIAAAYLRHAGASTVEARSQPAAESLLPDSQKKERGSWFPWWRKSSSAEDGTHAARSELSKAPKKYVKQWTFFPDDWKAPTAPREFTRVHTFTLVSFASLAVPLAMAFELGKDPTAHYFAGPWAYLAPLAPCFALVGYLLHLRFGRLTLTPVFIAMVPGMFLLALIANAYVRSTLSPLPEILTAKDCLWYDMKEKIEKSAVLAEKVYEDCLADHFRKSRSQGAPRLFQIQECQRYLIGHSAPPAPTFRDNIRHALFGPHAESKYISGVHDIFAEHRSTWRYLEKMEEVEHCSGWCEERRPIWTNEATKDACSSVAGFAMAQKVRPTAYGLLAYSTVVMLTSLLGTGYLTAQGVIHTKWAEYLFATS